MTRNIILFHALFKDGYQFSFDNENEDILVYSNGCFMFKAFPCKGIYEIVECISNNGNMILNVGLSNELDKSKLWHSCLGHVNKKCIAQLQKDGVLESFDFKLDDVCESCLLAKMTKSPFTRTCERGDGLLDLVHTDVCGPFRSATKDEKRYYVTFTDDFTFEEFNCLLKIDSDLFTYDIQEFKTYDEYEQELNYDETQGLNEQYLDINRFCNGGELPGMVRVGRMTYFQDHKWYDGLIDGCLKNEALMLKERIEGSWGDATPSIMKFCTWLRDSFENFHELGYYDNRLQGPYTNTKLNGTYDHYLDTDCMPEKNYNAKLRRNIQEGQGYMENLAYETSACKIRKFEMMKYTFEVDEEYVAIKELINHSETNEDARYAYRELFHKMDDGWLVTRATK
ncbi:retrotransposon protein, putative, ty1-copia subclass [Tanacetum coccineum]